MGLLSRHAFFVTLALVVSAFSAGQVHAQSIIDTTAVARGTITAQKIDGSVHALAIGTPLHQNDTIQTGTDGIVELLFIDQTVMTLGPNSQLRLDELVFQPNAGGEIPQYINHRGGTVLLRRSAEIGLRGPNPHSHNWHTRHHIRCACR